MAVDTVYENQDTVSPRLNKQYTTVVNLGIITVWYDGLKERLFEHADHIKTLGQFIRPPPTPPKNNNNKTHTHTKTKTHPFKLNLSVNHCQWKTAATLCTQCQGNFFSVCNQEIPIRNVRCWEPEEHASFLCAKNWIHTWFSAWHTSRTCHSYQK